MHDAGPTRKVLPLILIRGFGGLDVEDEKKLPYQGFNEGTVYHQRRGENYIYEGLVLRLLKSQWEYVDATNVVAYYPRNIQAQAKPAGDAQEIGSRYLTDHKIVIDPEMAVRLRGLLPEPNGFCRTLWVFRYYDLVDRQFENYGRALVRLIACIQELGKKLWGMDPPPPVNIIAHSMGGLIVREAIQTTYRKKQRRAKKFINKVVTLGTPHQGISFQVLRKWLLVDAADELNRFNPDFQDRLKEPASFHNLHKHFPLERLLTVVGTQYRTYSVALASRLNRLFGISGEFGLTYNRSDGLVQQTYAQVPGAPRTFVHKCHGGEDSLVTSREAFEIATRFLFGNVRVRLRLLEAKVTRGLDWFGRSEFFFGVSIKPRRVDFDLFHQSKEAENCYGPFRKTDLSDREVAFEWGGPDRLIWEGYFDLSQVFAAPSAQGDQAPKDLVFRLDFYVGERDRLGYGFSDNIVFQKQYYVRALWQPADDSVVHFDGLYLHTGEQFEKEDFTPSAEAKMKPTPDGWQFDVKGTGFEATLGIAVDSIPESGPAKPIEPAGEATED